MQKQKKITKIVISIYAWYIYCTEFKIKQNQTNKQSRGVNKNNKINKWEGHIVNHIRLSYKWF